MDQTAAYAEPGVTPGKLGEKSLIRDTRAHTVGEVDFIESG